MALDNLLHPISEMDDRVYYHYTSEAGLKGIIESNYLRATSFAFMNDGKEVETGRLAFEELSVILDDPVYGELGPQIRKAIVESAASITSWDVFGCCLCSSDERRDLATQWDKYGANHSGYAIGFRTKDLVDVDASAYAMNVVYANHLEAAKFIISQLLLEMKQHVIQFPSVPRDEAYVKTMIDILVPRSLAMFKDPKWEAECEFRVMFDPIWAKENKHLRQSYLRDGKTVRFIPLRPKHGLKLPIVEVVIGSQRGPDAEQELRAFLDSSGYPHVEISRSICGPST